MSTGRALLLAVLLVGTATDALWPGDEAVADASWAAASADKGGDHTARIFVDAARESAQVAPWQPSWDRARDRVRIIGEARRRVLVDDRGARRRPVEPVR